MRKLRSTVSHLVVIGLALTALLVATVVWLFERARGDSTRSLDEIPEESAISETAMLESSAPEGSARVARERKAASDGISL